MEGKRVIILSDSEVDWLWYSLNHALRLIDTDTYLRELNMTESNTIDKFFYLLLHELDATVPYDLELVQSCKESVKE